MLINEVKKIKGMNEEELRKLICEIYKAVPKKVREEKSIDSLYEGSATVKTKKTPVVDMKALADEIDQFVDNAYCQYYLAPNRVVPKSERPKWRFKVKNYYKQLTAVTNDDPMLETAARLLRKLYKMLAPEGISSWCQYSFMYEPLLRIVGEYDYPVLLETALETEKELGNIKPAKNSFSQFRDEEKKNVITDFIAVLYLSMGKTEDALNHMYRFEHARDKEIILYKILTYYIDEEKDPEEWIRCYKDGLKRGIKPRDSLKERYTSVSAVLRNKK